MKKKYPNFDTFQKFLIKYQEKSLWNGDRESGKTRKKSGKSQGIPCLKFGRHPVFLISKARTTLLLGRLIFGDGFGNWRYINFDRHALRYLYIYFNIYKVVNKELFFCRKESHRGRLWFFRDGEIEKTDKGR